MTGLLLRKLGWVFLAGVMVGCASRREMADSYGEILKSARASTPSNRTVVFFLVDGLPLRTLTAELSRGRLSSMRSFFLGSENFFYRAHTSFPSLTFPAIFSLLSERPIDQHGVY